MAPIQSCDFVEYLRKMPSMPETQMNQLENIKRKKRDLNPKKAELSCWCILLYYLYSMSIDNTLTQLNHIYDEISRNAYYFITWNSLKRDNQFFAVSQMSGWNNYQNLVYSAIIRLYHPVDLFGSDEATHLLPYVTAVVNYRQIQQSRISVENQDVGHIRVLLLWEILEIVIQSIITNDIYTPQTVSRIAERLRRLGFDNFWVNASNAPPITDHTLVFYFLLGLNYNCNSIKYP